MKWLIGIAIVMGIAHLYFRHGQRRLEQARREPAQREGGGAEREEDGSARSDA